MDSPVLLDIADGIATITLNRPERLNAFDAETAAAWVEATAEATSRDDVRAIVVQAEGRAFCAGGDVRSMATMNDRSEMIHELALKINVGLLNLLRSSLPVVAAAHGTTAGGGLGLLLCSDYAIVGESSKIGSLYAGVGLTPDLSVSALLSRAIGERRALQLTLQDRLLSAEQARDWGLVAEVVADDQVQARALEIAKHWVDNAALAYGQAKRLVRSQPDRSLEEQLAEEAATISRSAGTAEADALIQKFAAK